MVEPKPSVQWPSVRLLSAGWRPWTPVGDQRSSSPSLDDLLAAYRSDRKKRNFSLGVAGKCCSQGCTKNDIGRLC